MTTTDPQRLDEALHDTLRAWPVIWRPIPQWEGLYEISSHGHVRSIDRVNSTGRRVRGRVLRGRPNRAGHLRVRLMRGGEGGDVYIHQLVIMTFVGPRPPGLVVRHLDGDPTNNHVWNLKWGTNAENSQDAVRHGRNKMANRTHCSESHPLDGLYRSRGYVIRYCKTCKSIRRSLPDPGASQLPSYDQETIDQVRVLYGSGMSQERVANALGVSTRTVALIMRAADISRRESTDGRLTGQEIPLALACAAEHPFIPGALCRVVGPHDLHDYDGLDDWATDLKENDR